MKRQNLYKYLYNNHLGLYSRLFLIRQLVHFFGGQKSFNEWGKKSITEHFDWELKNNLKS